MEFSYENFLRIWQIIILALAAIACRWWFLTKVEKKMFIHSCSRFISPAVNDTKVYKQEISKYIALKFRRANKFVLLSLVGACQCAHGQAVKTDTAVYLTTENGTLGDTETVLDQLYYQHEFPMPYNFINTFMEQDTSPFSAI